MEGWGGALDGILAILGRGFLFVRHDGQYRGEGTVASDAGAVDVEADGDGDEAQSDAAEERAGPVDTHAIEHVRGEEREAGASQRTQEGVGGNSGGGEHEVGVDEVVEGLQEDGQEPKTGHEPRKSGHNPVDVGAVARPAEPEETAGEGHTAVDDRWQTPFWNRDVVISLELTIVACLGQHDIETGQEHPDDHPEVWQSSNTTVEAMDLLENDRVGR